MQVTVLVLIVGTISLLFRKSSSSFRYWLWSIVVLRMCIPVQLKLPLTIEDTIHNLSAAGLNGTLALIRPSYESALSTSNSYSTSTLFHVPPLHFSLFFSIWMGIVAFLLLGTIIRIVHLHYTLKKSTPISRKDLLSLLETLRGQLHIKGDVKLYYLNFDPNSGPALIGIIHPKIFLPYSMAETWTAEEIRPILVHELVHVKRHDQLFNWIQVFVQIVYFFHPLVWYANWRARHFREESCDDISIHILEHKRKKYSECIYNALQESGREPLWGFTNVSFSERRNSLAKRIIRILDKEYQANIHISVKLILTLVMIASMSLYLPFNFIGKDERNFQSNQSTTSVAQAALAMPSVVINPNIVDSTGYKADIYLTCDGKIYLYGKEITMNGLKKEISRSSNLHSLVRILADYGVDTRLIIQLTAVLYQCGVDKVHTKFK